MDIYDIIYGLAVIAIGFGLGIVLARITLRLTRPFAGEARGKSLGRVVQWVVIIVFVMIGVLVLFGASATAVALVVGALTFALTFGAQNVIQNFVAGLLIAIDGRLQIGQWVEIGDRPWQTGPAEVLDISLQKVKIRESGGKVYFVPNSYIFMHKLLNFSESGYMEVLVPMTLPIHEDTERAKQALIEAANESEYVFPNAKRSEESMVRLPGRKHMGGGASSELTPDKMRPVVRLMRATQDGVEYQVSMWTPFPERRDQIASDYLRRAILGLKAANIRLKDMAPVPVGAPAAKGIDQGLAGE